MNIIFDTLIVLSPLLILFGLFALADGASDEELKELGLEPYKEDK